MGNKPLIYCAIDTYSLDIALTLSKKVIDAGCGLKLGMEFYHSLGPSGVNKIKDTYPEASIFLDLKLHDIPNTVSKTIKSLCSVKPDFINIHASGGIDMMHAARDACDDDIKLLAVTVLTSLKNNDLKTMGYQLDIEELVALLATQTQKAGLDGVVCSPLEIKKLRALCGDSFVLMVPGIREKTDNTQDQNRTMSASEAVSLGASHLVIGRPITQANDPFSAAQQIIKSVC
jgi:orotidine-5'-phosphate decarboxylase